MPPEIARYWRHGHITQTPILEHVIDKNLKFGRLTTR